MHTHKRARQRQQQQKQRNEQKKPWLAKVSTQLHDGVLDAVLAGERVPMAAITTTCLATLLSSIRLILTPFGRRLVNG